MKNQLFGWRTSADGGSEIFAGLGLVVSADGIIVADLRSYNAGSSLPFHFKMARPILPGKSFIDDKNSFGIYKNKCSPKRC